MQASQTALFDALKAAGPSRADSVARLNALATLMDSAITVPGTRFRIGLDAAIGLVPGIGDAVSALISSYIIWEARQLGLPRWKIARMIGNVAVDTAVGAIPFVGDAFDVMFKSNRRNMRILNEHIAREGQAGIIKAEYRVVETKR